MSTSKKQFEKELKNKLLLKSSGYQTEETVLLKAFKYFDLDNSGHCSSTEFIRAINKIGIIGFNDDNLKELFAVYDTDGSGSLDYKEFVGVLYGNVSLKSEAEKKKSATQQKQTKQEELSNEEVIAILEKIRAKLVSRGVRGIISIGRNFRIIDDDNSHTIDINEFKKACKDFRFDLTEDQIAKAFSAFDRKNNGVIDYDEFLRTIRGEMNDFRRALVNQVFEIMDKNKNGVIDIEDIKEVYNARKHPDVQSGKKSEDAVLMEFIETLEANHVYLNGTQPDQNVTTEEFMEYYENVSMSIDDDEYFEVMMNNVWRMNENTTYANDKQGWSNKKEEEKPVSELYSKKTQKEKPKQTFKITQKKVKQEEEQQKDEENEQIEEAKNAELAKFRILLISRGGDSIIGLARQFKILDDNNSKTLDIDEFTKAIKEYKLQLTPEEIKTLFSLFDRDGSGLINYDEFLRTVCGSMSPKRQKVVLQAFDKLDLDKSGVIELSEIKSLYNAKNNKDVLSGKKTEEEVYGEFIETFEMHHNLKKGYRDRRVTREEFIEYYNNISMSIDKDEYFITMVQNAWKLIPQPSYMQRAAVAGDYKKEVQGKVGRALGEKHRKVGNAKNAPYGTDNEPINYATTSNPKGRLNRDMMFSNKGEDVILKFREKIAARGTRGIMSIRRAFMIADDNNTKSIDIKEFSKFCRDYRVGLNENEVKKLFAIFDRNKSGAIDYDEFIRGIVGEMNDFRTTIVKKVFSKFDKNGNGIVEPDDLRENYSTLQHPDVLSGKKTEDEVLEEFLDTFEYHFSLLNEGQSKDGKITLEEFIEYYNNISMSIQDDQYFEMMMTNAWNLDNKQNYGRGWKGEY